MEKYIDILKDSRLFAGVKKEDIRAMMSCMSAKISSYKKGEYIFRQGDILNNLFIVLEGSVHIQSDDYWGNRSILNEVNKGGIFGEAYAVHNTSPTLNDAVASNDSVIAVFSLKKMMTVCSNMCRFHSLVIENLVDILATNNLSLVQKLTHITKRSTREKLISYLSLQSKLNHSSSFSIPFNRQQLADFLSIDRSAMSNELCKMRDEGLIEFHKNNFTLL